MPAPVKRKGCNCGKNKKRAQMPHFAKQVENAASAAGRVMTNAVTGQRILVDSKVRKKRLEICQACDRCDGSRCSECGCYVAAKTTLTSEECPLNQWE